MCSNLRKSEWSNFVRSLALKQLCVLSYCWRAGHKVTSGSRVDVLLGHRRTTRSSYSGLILANTVGTRAATSTSTRHTRRDHKTTRVKLILELARDSGAHTRALTSTMTASVSRRSQVAHSQLSQRSLSFYLYGNSSKFGTDMRWAGEWVWWASI